MAVLVLLWFGENIIMHSDSSKKNRLQPVFYLPYPLDCINPVLIGATIYKNEYINRYI